MAAFRPAAKLGYKYLEMDVISTKDRQVVVIHVAKNPLEAKRHHKELPDYLQLQEMTYQELKDFTGRDIPTLAQILKIFPNNKMIIDAKTDRVVELLTKTLLERKAAGRVLVGSFYPRRILELHRLLGKKTNYQLIISRSPVHLASQLGHLRHMPFISAVAVPYMYATKRIIRRLQARGVKVLVWTPNTRFQISNAIRRGADGIISDRIDILKDFIEP